MPRIHRIEGTLVAELREPGGPVVARRRASNTVLRSGAELLGALFTGKELTPVNGMAVGLSSDPSGPPYEVATLTTKDGGGNALVNQPAVAIPATDFVVETLANEFRVRVSLRGLLPASHGVSPNASQETVLLGEAALGVLAPDGQSLARIYNRVVMDPLPKSRKQELALYWEISFPYGH